MQHHGKGPVEGEKEEILKREGNFPGGPVVKNPPAMARDTDSTQVREDSSCCGATKPVHRNY